jgi:hypothetical protein
MLSRTLYFFVNYRLIILNYRRNLKFWNMVLRLMNLFVLREKWIRL